MNDQSPWPLESLSEVCSLITDGSHFSPKTIADGFPYITVRDVSDAGIDFVGCKFISENSYLELKKNGCQPEKGDVLFSKDGTVGRVVVVDTDRPFVVLSSLAILRPRPEKVLPEYLKLVLESPTVLENALGMKTGTALTRVVLRNLKTLVIPVPPLNEQLAIVNFLSRALTSLEQTVAKVANAQNKSTHLRMAILHQIFTVQSEADEWLEETIGDVVTPISGKQKTQRGWSPQCLAQPVSDDTKWGVLKTTAIQAGEYWPQYNKELPSKLEPKPHLAVEVGDLIMTSTGPRTRCGVPCLVEATPPNLIMSGKMFRVRPDTSKIHPRWMLYFLLSPGGQAALESLKVGSSDSSLSIGSNQFLEIAMPVPPMEIQEQKIAEIEDCFSLADSFDDECDSAKSRFTALRRSIMFSTFNGTIKPRSINA